MGWQNSLTGLCWICWSRVLKNTLQTGKTISVKSVSPTTQVSILQLVIPLFILCLSIKQGFLMTSCMALQNQVHQFPHMLPTCAPLCQVLTSLSVKGPRASTNASKSSTIVESIGFHFNQGKRSGCLLQPCQGINPGNYIAPGRVSTRWFKDYQMPSIRSSTSATTANRWYIHFDCLKPCFREGCPVKRTGATIGIKD